MISSDTRLVIRKIINENKNILEQFISNELHVEISRYTESGFVYKVKKSNFGKDFEHSSLYYLNILKPAINNFLRNREVFNELINYLAKVNMNNDRMLNEVNVMINNTNYAMQLFNIKALNNNIIFISY